MILMAIYHLVLLLPFWPGCQGVPSRESSWHGKPVVYTDYVTVSACADTTSVKENPWTAILWYDNDFVCGATILNDDLAITAAHCVIGKRNDFLKLYYGRTIQPDSATPDRGAENYGGVTGIRAVRIHPNYDLNQKYEGSDIAVLKLKKKISYNHLVRPISVIPTKSKYTKMLERGAYVKVAGFGQSSGPVHGHTDRDYPTHMQMISQRIVPHQQCNRGTGPQSIGPARDVLCTRGKCGNGKDANGTEIYKQICPGDSGSGIVGLFQEENEFYLLGVVSYIVTPNQEDCGKSGKPAFSISTRDHRDFIYEEFNLPDPVNCSWGYWAEWTHCSKSCGEGTRTRTRRVDKESRHGGEACQGDYKQEEKCNNYCPPDPEPVHCQWDSWAAWTPCSKSCGGGTRTRARSIYQQPRYGGKTCQGRDREEGKCSTNDCPKDPEPVHCQWDSWAAWGPCSKSCGGGIRTRSRKIYEQPICVYQGRGREEGKCSTDDCPKEEGKCTPDDFAPVDGFDVAIPQIDKSCRPGEACKTREYCPDVQKKYCEIQGLKRKHENPKKIVNQLKAAVCNKKEKAFCCKGEKETSLGLKVMEPTDGDWSPWSAWTSCSSTCGGGAQGRTRQCARSNPYDCPKQLEQQTRNCNSKPCKKESSSDKICETVTEKTPITTTTTPGPTSTTEYSRIRIKLHTSFTFTRKIFCRDRK